MKRSPLRHQSSKQRKMIRTMKDERAEYLAEHLCQCGCGRKATEVHEIVSGVHRRKGYVHRIAWLALFWLCHKVVQNMKIAQQLALKAVFGEEEDYDRAKVNELRSRGPNAVSECDVIRAAYELGKNGIEKLEAKP